MLILISMNICILSLAFISASYADETSDKAIAECRLVLDIRYGQVAEQIIYVHGHKNNARNLVALEQGERILAIGKLWIDKKVAWIDARDLILGYIGEPINYVSLVGRQTIDPDHKFLPDGRRVSTTSLAINSREGEAYFYKVDCWERKAEILQDYGCKGQNLGVDGKLYISQWEQDHQQRQKLYIVADRIQLLGNKPALV